jgi:hypothetical protein
VLVGVLLAIVTVLSLVVYGFWYVPHALGHQYVSVSFTPRFYSGPGTPYIHMDYNGEAMAVSSSTSKSMYATATLYRCTLTTTSLM